MTTASHFVIVTFETEPSAQGAAPEKTGTYVGSFLSKQPGFVESVHHKGLYNVWQTF